MLSQNYNNYNIQQPPQQISFQNSYESTGGSYNNGSLLTAANTLTFNSPPSSYNSVPFTPNQSSPLSKPSSLAQQANEASDFSKALLNIQSQQNSNEDDLDFDLHYSSEDGKGSKAEGLNKNDVLFEDDLTCEFEQAIKNFEEDAKTRTNQSVNRHILNNPINFVLADSVKKSNLENSPGSSASFAGVCSYNSAQSTTPQNSVQTKFSTNRTLMKMQLMKQQTEQIEKKSLSFLSSSAGQFDSQATPTLNGFHNQHFNTIRSNNIKELQHSPSVQINSTNTNNNIDKTAAAAQEDMPSSLTTLEIIPRSVLAPAYQNEIKLDNPTKYHVMQIAKNLQQTTIDHSPSSTPSSSFNKSMTNKTNNLRSSKPQANNSYQMRTLNQSDSMPSIASSGDIAVLPHNSSFYADSSLLDNFSPSQQSVDSQNSNFLSNNTYLSSPSSSFSQADFLDEIGDFIPEEFDSLLNKKSLSVDLSNLEIQEEINRIEECLNLPKTLPNENCLQSPSSFSQQASSSCPADIVRIKQLQGLNLTPDEIKLIVKDRQKKDNHNMIERRRRFNINDRIKELGTILPKSNVGEIKQNKGSILKASVDYIKNLKHEVHKSKELEEKFRQMSILNRKLINRINELEIQTKTNNNTQVKASTTNNFNIDNDVVQIKQEPQMTLLNLVTMSEKPISPTQPPVNNNFHTQQQNGYVQKFPNSSSQAPVSSSQFRNNPQTDFQQLSHISVLSDALVSNDLLSTSGDPLFCNPNLYNENMMDM